MCDGSSPRRKTAVRNLATTVRLGWLAQAAFVFTFNEHDLPTFSENSGRNLMKIILPIVLLLALPGFLASSASLAQAAGNRRPPQHSSLRPQSANIYDRQIKILSAGQNHSEVKLRLVILSTAQPYAKRMAGRSRRTPTSPLSPVAFSKAVWRHPGTLPLGHTSILRSPPPANTGISTAPTPSRARSQ